jgi:pSer/pThr/pTyr-binding forkhead associated (FHA) protein
VRQFPEPFPADSTSEAKQMSISPTGDSEDALATFGVLQGAQFGEVVPVRSVSVRIGSAERNDLVISDDSVSASHAVLEFEDGAWRLTDLDSTNGTVVEGVRLAPQVPTPLPYGSSVRVGGVRLQFRAVAGARPEEAPPPEPATEPEERPRRRALPVWLLVVVAVLLALVIFAVVVFASPPAGVSSAVLVPLLSRPPPPHA